MGKAWIIASGKGGVGKSTVTASLGAALTDMSQRICIVDADIGLRDQDVILGVENRVVYDLLDVCEKRCRMDQALIRHADFPNLFLVPAAQFARSKDLDKKAFRRMVHLLKCDFEHVLIDCPAGIERGLRSILNEEADETILICTPDDVCIRNVERACSVLQRKEMPSPRLIVNMIDPDLVREGEMYSAKTVSQTLDIPLLGEIPYDPIVYRSLILHMPLVKCECEARNAIIRIAARMNGNDKPLPAYGSEKLGFFARLRSRKLKEVKQL